MAKKIVFVTLALTLISAVTIWQISRSWTFTLIGSLVNRVETTEPLIALTFDDGPIPGPTERVLEILGQHGAKATFFVVGRELVKNMEQGKKIVEAGHELGNHSFSHKRMVLRTPTFVREEISRTDELIRTAGHVGKIHFRPPYAKKFLVLPYILKEQKRLNIFMDLAPDSLSEIADDREKITRYVVENAGPGSIVLMHVMYGNEESMAAVPEILRQLGAKGYRFVTVSELLSAGTPMESPVHLAGEI